MEKSADREQTRVVAIIEGALNDLVEVGLTRDAAAHLLAFQSILRLGIGAMPDDEKSEALIGLRAEVDQTLSFLAGDGSELH